MAGFYELIGRMVVGFVRRRYGQQIRVAALVGVGIASAAAVVAYAATRDEQDA
jgi:hypothetical protein